MNETNVFLEGFGAVSLSQWQCQDLWVPRPITYDFCLELCLDTKLGCRFFSLDLHVSQERTSNALSAKFDDKEDSAWSTSCINLEL